MFSRENASIPGGPGAPSGELTSRAPGRLTICSRDRKPSSGRSGNMRPGRSRIRTVVPATAEEPRSVGRPMFTPRMFPALYHFNRASVVEKRIGVPPATGYNSVDASVPAPRVVGAVTASDLRSGEKLWMAAPFQQVTSGKLYLSVDPLSSSATKLSSLTRLKVSIRAPVFGVHFTF